MGAMATRYQMVIRKGCVCVCVCVFLCLFCNSKVVILATMCQGPSLLNQSLSYSWASQVALVVKNSPANGGDIRDAGLIPRLGRSLGGGHGYPLQYSCLEKPMDREAWQATVHMFTQSWTRLKRLSMHSQMYSQMLHLLSNSHADPGY